MSVYSARDPATGDEVAISDEPPQSQAGELVYSLNRGPFLPVPRPLLKTPPIRIAMGLLLEYLEQRRAADPAEELTLP